jgi:hypothetical protein
MLKPAIAMITVTATLAFTSSTTRAQQAYEILDGFINPCTLPAGVQANCTATQRSGMHACPAGRYITGASVTEDVDLNRNIFLCALISPSYNTAEEFEDVPPENEEQGMHACPKGSVLTGMEIARKTLLCAPSPLDPTGTDPSVVRYRDESILIPNTGHRYGLTQRWAMHACPIGDPMVGIHLSDNIVLCETKLPFVPAFRQKK